MATKKQSKEFKGLTKDELTQAIAKAEKALFDARFKKSTGTLENSALIWKTRKELARFKTAAGNMGRASSGSKKVG